MTDHMDSDSFAAAEARIERSQAKIRIVVITICVLILAIPVSMVTLIFARPLMRKAEQARLDHYDKWRLGMTLAECLPLIDKLNVGDLAWEVNPNFDGWEGYVHQYTINLANPTLEWTTLELTFEVPLPGAAAASGTAPAQPGDEAVLKYIELSKPPVSDAEFAALSGRMKRRFGPYDDHGTDMLFWPNDSSVFGLIDYFSGHGGGPRVSLRQNFSHAVSYEGPDRTSLNLYIMTDAEYMD